ncbi:SsgA family sporulation/cell division regulator [Pseudonocardia acaciae]|jgi:hypothetical protein|uniref:SsgA family sporulation/cell division regulator n=1 Tax=Pseudonocardia acaciae TaxID=551276 RepID=UPI00048DC566|nr:SsgA family sporulation/cell division regulator [Pseudonocardia acaciae]
MRNEHVTIRSLAVFDLLAQQADAMPVRVELRYDSRDPYAVHAVFQTGRTDAADVEWVFARDLFADGLLTEAGTGDVRVRPAAGDPDTVEIELSSPSGHALFSTSAPDLADFLDRTFEAVPPGSEYAWLDLDLALEDLLSSEAS